MKFQGSQTVQNEPVYRRVEISLAEISIHIVDVYKRQASDEVCGVVSPLPSSLSLMDPEINFSVDECLMLFKVNFISTNVKDK